MSLGPVRPWVSKAVPALTLAQSLHPQGLVRAPRLFEPTQSPLRRPSHSASIQPRATPTSPSAPIIPASSESLP